jgi:glutamate/tyrosine decarboxylase-like PLP-dependent enzyme
MVAREVAGNPEDPVVYVSDQGHSSLERAARIVGVPPGGVRKLPTDRHYRLQPSELERAVREDRAARRSPICVCASAGATNTGAVDPLDEVSGICRERGIWFHVDGAYGGFAILTEAGKEAFRGIELADSVTLDPHKWLFQPYETGCLLVRDTSLLESAFRILPEYLQDADMGMEHVNFADRGLQLTRSFRALKIWMSIQAFGVDAFRATIDEAMELAREAERHIVASDTLELLSPATLGVVCFRYQPAGMDDSRELEEVNTRIQRRIVDSGFAMMSSTRLRGEYSLRLCILNFRTRWNDVRATLERIESTGGELMEEWAEEG